MNRDEICALLTEKIKQLKNNEQNLQALLPEIQLIYGTRPNGRRR